ncbi:unnamed protein product [Commensalibacter communis]|uniref:KAP NTPase domain-containing protein n=1 Tax=Commensalibacter communis TaxID=2972786 RepID=A0A9W4TN46_9PROT|nr:P-loop NTPase fold protein [Commensalibacter communis]CAI3954201.1 unnamed protein product [Commensalibacter communis]CAI3955946.1 unnamed protein product [Commensalibacter communis]CAI3956333.1 unnamed protein product [Commensalibacter communis]CAI3957331.1 unnamed protein product [Commensalibacter communis]
MTKTSNNNSDQNQHITDYLTYYINKEEPADSAILLTGSWGCGKTYYIDQFIAKINAEEKQKAEKEQQKYIFKMSVFGLKTIADLDDQISQEICYSLEPGLGQSARILGKTLAVAGTVWNCFDVPIKIKQDKLQEASKNLSKKLEKLLFSKNKSNIIFVFDDLERTDIPLKELLGHINAFVERDHIKVILIANEDELTKEFTRQEQKEETSETKPYTSEDDLKNREIYIKFKEKVISKTFEVQSDFDDTLSYFIQNNPYQNLLLEHDYILKEVYKTQTSINLRQLKQALDDFTYLLDNLEEKHQQHPQFVKELIRTFIGVKLAIYRNDLTKQIFETLLPSSEPQEESNPYEFKRITDSLREAVRTHLRETNKIDNKFKDTSKKYQIQTWLYSLSIWFDILFTNKMANITQATNQLIYFIPKLQQPLWMQSYHFPALSEEDFQSLSQRLVKNFLSFKQEPFYDLLHIIQLMISWSNNGLIDIHIETIKSTAQKSLNEFTPYWIGEWQNIYKGESLNFEFNNQTGYGYYLDEDFTFQEIWSLFRNKRKEIIKHIKKEQEEEQITSVLQALHEDTREKSINLLLNPNIIWKPIFHKIEKEKLIDILFGLDNNQLFNFNQILKQRYLTNDRLNKQVTCFYMTPEFLFWHYIKVAIETHIDATKEYSQPLQKYNLKQLLETIHDIIETTQPFFITESLDKNNYADLEEYLCNSSQYTQQAIFDKQIKESFMNSSYRYEKHQIDELHKILIKRYDSLSTINIIKTEFSFWQDIIIPLKDDDWSPNYMIDKIQVLIQQLEQIIKQKTSY